MIHLINEQIAQEHTSEIERDARRRAEHAHELEVERVRASVLLVPRKLRHAAQEA